MIVYEMANKSTVEVSLKKKTAEIYVDGSFNNNIATFAWIAVENNQEIASNKGFSDNNEVLAHRQVWGEITAVLDALRWCLENKVKESFIFYDYAGLEAWSPNAKKPWAANNDLTKRYKAELNEICEKLTINWLKVKSHSGNFWNEAVDKLAKSAYPEKTEIS